ncbi:hypothetical protein CEJ95_12645 [Staphylococcus aureus]|nr:hypothetical protein FQP77_04500 [Staphylococcus aureus]KAA0454314.1 hypothetical protein FQP76_03160 [Staphylococcus aureus]NAM36651.1 hypothetical protein [Staphylococcus aureus]OWU40621.1 hypothetical protein CEJ95_12645 [Staphylococcus aureus]
MRNYRDISYILNERGFNVHHLTPSKLLSPHTEFFSFTYDTPQRIVLYWGFYNNNGPYIFKD